MFVEYLRYSIPPSRAAGFLDTLGQVTSILQEEAQCLSYEVAQAQDEPNRFVVRIEWDSLASDEFRTLVLPYADDVEESGHYDVRTASPALPEKGVPSLYEWCGGQPAVSALINAFYDSVERDELLSPFFPGGVSAEHREHVSTWWCEVLGGPSGYTALGGYPRMLAHHLGLDIKPEQRLRFAMLMSLAADAAGLPDDPEFRAAFVGYVEWGTRIALHNARPGADVVRDAPVPHWGWGVAPPYLG